MRLLSKLVPGLVLLCSAMAMPAAAQSDYPNKPIRWIVPYPPGGTTDLLARLMGQHLSQKLGQQVIIENKAGGGNNIGTEFSVKAPPDGYTIHLVNPANAINATLYPKLPFNFLEDLVPIAGLIRVPNVMTVTKNFPARNVQEFIDYGKKNPGKINMASSGAGTSVHLSGELFKSMAGVDMVHIPYKGAGPALTDLLGNHVPIMFDNLPSSTAYIKDGRLRGLAVTSAERAASMPDLPTIAESGLPGYETYTWNALFAPAGTPPDVIAKLNAEAVAAVNDPAVKAKLATFGATTVGSTPDELATHVKAELAKWAPIVKASGARID
jgi:tripartite-type tricarboxylate transporter receptor subunit TctC